MICAIEEDETGPTLPPKIETVKTTTIDDSIYNIESHKHVTATDNYLCITLYMYDDR